MRNIRTKEHFFVPFIQCDKTGNLNKYSGKCLVMTFLRNDKISLTGTLKLVWVSHTKKVSQFKPVLMYIFLVHCTTKIGFEGKN